MKFDDLLAADYKKPTIALFYGLNCSPCERLKPKLKEACASLNVRLESFNAEQEMDAVKAHGIRSVPTVLVVDNGVASVLFSGDIMKIKEKIETVLKG